MKFIVMTALVATTLVVSGCGLFGKKNVSSGQGSGVTEYEGPPATEGAPDSNYPNAVQIGDSSANSGSALGGASSENLVYFEYDSTTISSEGLSVIARYGRYLSESPAARVRLEGHTDERGTREYNIGLGERRAIAVQEALLAAGASAAQLSLISYGEERPVSTGQTEQAWAQNRRVEIVK